MKLEINGVSVTQPEGATLGGVLAFTAAGAPYIASTPATVINKTLPEVPASPDAQDVVDALVLLGLVTQAEA